MLRPVDWYECASQGEEDLSLITELYNCDLSCALLVVVVGLNMNYDILPVTNLPQLSKH